MIMHPAIKSVSLVPDSANGGIDFSSEVFCVHSQFYIVHLNFLGYPILGFNLV